MNLGIFIFSMIILLVCAGAVLLVAASAVFNALGLLWGGLLFMALTCVYGGSLAWVWRDARARGATAWASVLMVAVTFWPMGLLIWVACRPGKKTPLAAPPVLS